MSVAQVAVRSGKISLDNAAITNAKTGETLATVMSAARAARPCEARRMQAERALGATMCVIDKAEERARPLCLLIHISPDTIQSQSQL